MALTHEQLCERARRWLSGTKRCEPVFSNIASCDEIPDAIGWCSSWKNRGSIVVECKTSVSDFHADKRKYTVYVHPVHGWKHSASRLTLKEVKEVGYTPESLPNMGNYRYYLCDAGVLTLELVEKHMPDHGLLYVEGRRIRVIREAPRREEINKDAEIRYLRFAIINGKTAFIEPPVEDIEQLGISL